MNEYFYKFFDTSDFPARWHCGTWSEFLGWLHILSDIATCAAYFAIPAVLIYFARKRQDFPFTKLFWLFAGFIVACGTVHLIEAIIFWHPIYRVSGMMKFITAVVSWATVIALVRVIPKVMHFPSLAATNERLESEIKSRRETEKELQAAKGRHEALLEGTRSIVWTTNPAGGFDRPQTSWQRYTGQDWDAHKDFNWVNAIHQDDRSELLRRWKSAIETQSKYQSPGRIWSEAKQSYRSFIAEAVPVISDEGNIIEWVGTVSDIEEQQQAETALTMAQFDLVAQKRELELIYEAAPVGLSLIDRNFRFLRVNETLAAINGFPKEAHIGRRADEMLPELHDQLYPIYDEVFASGKPRLNVEIVGTTPASKKTRTWLASYYPLTDESGNSVSVSAIVQDITDRKRTEKRLQESEAAALAASQSKSKFLANMSHEIRTPMAAILGYADVLLGHLKDPDNRNCVLIIKRNGGHLLELINDILDLSRIEAGKLDVELERCPLPQLVADILSLMQVRANEKKIKFTVAFDGQVPQHIHTDPTRLRQVLINLIGNAIKFTDEGEVTLRVKWMNEKHSPIVEFAVVDTGIGISTEQQQRLFKPFSQADSSVTRQYGGSGLGLAISHRLIDMLSGEMEVDSEIGKGSTFFVRVPIGKIDQINLINPDLTIYKSEPETTAAETPRLDCRVLVVDDRRDVRHISQHFLEKAGANVLTAEDGQQGIDVALAARDAGEPFGLIVMDMQMPNVDGMQAVAELRSAGIDWPIIALTADAMKGDRDKCLNGGCDDYLSKPIDQAKLIALAAKYTQLISQEELHRTRAERLQALKATLLIPTPINPEVNDD